MAQVHIPSAMRELTDGEAKLEIAGGTVRALVDGLDQRYPGFKARLVQDDRLRPGMTVFVDGANKRAGLRAKVTDGSEVYFLPAMGGGC